MKHYIKLNKDLTIEQIKKRNRTIISVINDKEKILLSDIETNNYYWNKLYRKLELAGEREEYEKNKRESNNVIC